MLLKVAVAAGGHNIAGEDTAKYITAAADSVRDRELSELVQSELVPSRSELV